MKCRIIEVSFLLLVVVSIGCKSGITLTKPCYDLGVPVPQLPFEPKTYFSMKSQDAIVVDGVLNEASWKNAEWSDVYVDIEGALKPAPSQQTRCKMCWDETCLYIAAELQETDLWATLTNRDSIIFYDNDFEVFIDPDGDHHQYYELEINALNTVWDLLLIKPYRDGAPAVHGWDIAGLKTAVSLQGTLNNSSDIDQGWVVEIAIPFAALKEASSANCPPKFGDRWKINFSRVQWDLDKKQDATYGYVKKVDPATGKSLPEHNWVWSPQGLINMHCPERWGIVEFCDAGARPQKTPEIKEEDCVKEALVQAYYQLRNQQAKDLPLKLTPQKLPAGWSDLKFEVCGYAFIVQTQKNKVVYSINHQSLCQRKVLP